MLGLESDNILKHNLAFRAVSYSQQNRGRYREFLCMSKIIQYFSFSFWLISLSIISSRSIHVVSTFFFIQSSIDDNLDCFHVLTLVNNAVMNIWVHTYFQISVFMFFGWASQVVLVVKNPPANAGVTIDKGSIPGSGRSLGGGHGNPLQYSCLENPMDRWAGQLQFKGLQRVRHDWSDFPWTHCLDKP